MDEVFRQKLREYDLEDVSTPEFRRLVRFAQAEGLLTGLLQGADSSESIPQSRSEPMTSQSQEARQ